MEKVNIDDGGAAFPHRTRTYLSSIGEWCEGEQVQGLSKRELFAALALHGMLANSTVVYAQSNLAGAAVEQADDLLTALRASAPPGKQ